MLTLLCTKFSLAVCPCFLISVPMKTQLGLKCYTWNDGHWISKFTPQKRVRHSQLHAMLKWGGGLNNQNLNLWHSEKLFVTLSHVRMHIHIRVDLADPALSGSGDWEGSFPAWTLRRPRCGEAKCWMKQMVVTQKAKIATFLNSHPVFHSLICVSNKWKWTRSTVNWRVGKV